MNLKVKEESFEVVEEQEDEKLLHVNLANSLNESIAINIKNLNEKDIESLKCIRPLLEGKEIYKKFSSSSSLSQIPFNPFEEKHPEKCKFGKRFVRLNPESVGQIFVISKTDIWKKGYSGQKKGKIYSQNLYYIYSYR